MDAAVQVHQHSRRGAPNIIFSLAGTPFRSRFTVATDTFACPLAQKLGLTHQTLSSLALVVAPDVLLVLRFFLINRLHMVSEPNFTVLPQPCRSTLHKVLLHQVVAYRI